MNSNLEIKNLEELRQIRNYRADDFIVITDIPTGDTIHIAFCKFVKESDFRVKVIENDGKFGKYYHFTNYSEAIREFPIAILILITSITVTMIASKIKNVKI